MKILNFPVNCNTEASRLSYCERAMELLRLEQNVMGTKFRNGEITESEYRNYINNDYQPALEALIKAQSQQQTLAKHGVPGTPWNIDLSRDIVDAI